MSNVCKLCIWAISFLIAVAIAQLLSLISWSGYLIVIVAAIAYIHGSSNADFRLQIIALGLILGWAKCYFSG